MMRKLFAVALMALLIGGLGFAQRAEAGVSYNFSFRSTDILGGALNGIVVGGGVTFSFSSLGDANACNSGTGAGCAVSDLLLVTTDSLIINSISVGFDNTNSLGVVLADEWHGTLVGSMMAPAPYAPPTGITIGANTIIEPRPGRVPALEKCREPLGSVDSYGF